MFLSSFGVKQPFLPFVDRSPASVWRARSVRLSSVFILLMTFN